MKEGGSICTKYGVLLIHDEVMNGVGQAGIFLASNHFEDVQPYIGVLAKGVAAGYTPIRVIPISDYIFNSIK